MTGLFAELALTPAGWAKDVRVEIGADGRIAAVTPDAAPEPGDERLEGKALLPALCNLHSHAFQRAIAGLGQRRGQGEDDFWSWRETMYALVDHLTPEDAGVIARLAFMEMAKAGYAAVGEFHYLHHQPGGALYANRAEMAQRVAGAAEAAGLGLTLLPVFYARGGMQDEPLQGGQLRFGHDRDGFAALMEGIALPRPDDVLGIAPHSLRAVTAEQLSTLADRHGGGPVHIHIAEQVKEVGAVRDAYGARPVEWLLDHVPVGPNWCAVHATHMSEAETAALARSGAVAGLCPITEADLGDGVFDAPGWRAAGGAWGAGTDSNVAIGAADELRVLEYSQRLTRRRRNVMCGPGESNGEGLYRAALKGGAQALGRDSGALQAGRWADLMTLDRGALALPGAADGRLLDAWIFSHPDVKPADAWSAGRRMVKDHEAPGEAAVKQDFEALITRLIERL